MEIRKEPSKLIITKDRVTVEFQNGRTLEASKDFFEFVGTNFAEPSWSISDLTNEDGQHRIACLDTEMDSEKPESIWFANKYFQGCGITTICEWYKKPESAGTKIKGKRLPNGQKVSQKHVVLPF